MEKEQVLPGQPVRVVVQGANGRVALVGHVLTVAPIVPENLGINGEPTITALVLTPTAANLAQLGRHDWYLALDRYTGLRHVSHPDVISGKVVTCYVDTIPVDEIGHGLNLDDLDQPILEPAPTKAGNEPVVHNNQGFKAFQMDGFVRVLDPDGDHVDDFQTLEDAKAHIESIAPAVQIRSVSPLTPDSHGLSQYDSLKKEQADKDAAAGKPTSVSGFLPEEVYVSEKTGVQVESMHTGTFCCYDKDGKLVTHETDKGPSTMVFPTKETAIEFADAYGQPGEEVKGTEEGTGKEETANVT